MFCKPILIFCLVTQALTQKASDYCSVKFDAVNTDVFSKHFIPPMEEKHKGDSGKIGIIGGSTEYTGAPYFAAMSALRAGADYISVITTESAAPVIKSYSPDLIVYPILHNNFLAKLREIILFLDLVVIGPGLGRDQHTLVLFYDIIQICKEDNKPLVIDADGLYALSKNMSVIEQYPTAGVVLTPNHKEAERLARNVPAESKTDTWTNYWGDNVSVLVKGKEDTFYSSIVYSVLIYFSYSFGWRLKDGGSPRRVAGQGDILAGALGTFYNWGIKADVCTNLHSVQLAQSFAAVAAANLTRKCNAIAFSRHGRSMIASDMLKEIHVAFDILMNKPVTT